MDLDEVAAAILLDETPRPRRRRADRTTDLRRHGSPLAMLMAAPRSDEARRRFAIPAVRAELRARAARFAAIGGRLLPAADPAYPARLLDLGWGPPWLYVRGSGELPLRTAAIVGTRKATPSAREIAFGLARGCVRAGVCVVSGLARGIDSAAHRGALAAGGPTVAVLGTGVDRCYPAANRALFAEILAGGLIMSEYPPGSPPLRQHFPARNRLLAALAPVVVVVQAPARSGALITATLAAEAGCDVLAVPGDPLLPENAGSNQLLAEGARVALGVDDVLSAVCGHEVLHNTPGDSGTDEDVNAQPLARPDRALLGELDLVPRCVEALARAAGAPMADVLAGLLRLELAGLVEHLPGGVVRLTPRAARDARRDAASPVEPAGGDGPAADQA